LAQVATEEAGRESAPLVSLQGITKQFPGVVANDSVDLDLRRGEIHALIGENGAGKSTLMRVLYGLYPPDKGTIRVQGRPTRISSPRAALAHGIGMVHQHFVLVDRFTVTENIVLGAEGGPLIDLDGAGKRIREMAESYGFNVDPEKRVSDLSVGQQQRVEILKALYRGVDLLILDEPTAVLTPSEAQDLFVNLQNLRGGGKTVVFISHKLDEVLAIADRITVLRRGKVVGQTTPADTSKEKLAEMMVGRRVLFEIEKPRVEIGQAVLTLEDVTLQPHLRDLSLQVRSGEILGIAGVEGNGQRELAEVVVGLRHPDSGRVLLGDRDLSKVSVADHREQGIAYVPEDRHHRGLVLDMSIWENSVLGRQNEPEFGHWGFLFIDKIKELAGRLIKRFDVRARGIRVDAATLSGGNQQKLILARELEGDPVMLVAHQPTRGLDVGAIEFIWNEILEQKAEGRAVLLISAELDEIYELSDRILTLYEGRFTGEFSPDTPADRLGLAMTGRSDKTQDT
jgi:general nucleoside transport system ATP-binding protein